MKKIQSFTVNHLKLKEGMYLSRQDGDADTYDLRFCIPNGGNYLDNVTMHSVEHLAATFLRNGPFQERILYFGPMGCQTGFYLIVRGMTGDEVKGEVLRVVDEILCYEGPMPGASAEECGNWRTLSLEAGKEACRRWKQKLSEREIDFIYEK